MSINIIFMGIKTEKCCSFLVLMSSTFYNPRSITNVRVFHIQYSNAIYLAFPHKKFKVYSFLQYYLCYTRYTARHKQNGVTVTKNISIPQLFRYFFSPSSVKIELSHYFRKQNKINHCS